MAGFFSMDGPFVKYGTLLFDMIILSAVWALMGGILPVMILLSTGILGMVPPIVGLLLIFICLLHWAPGHMRGRLYYGKKTTGNRYLYDEGFLACV